MIALPRYKGGPKENGMCYTRGRIHYIIYTWRIKKYKFIDLNDFEIIIRILDGVQYFFERMEKKFAKF